MSIKVLLKKASKLLPDKTYLQFKYFLRFHKFPDLKNPKTFNEKLQWLKLYDRKPIYSTMVDKYEAKKYVADIIGEEYIIPTLGVWDNFDDIDFEKLPNQFVLKCTHDSGGLVICTDKAKLDIPAARKKIEASLNSNYFYHGREWPYKNVKPRIIAEKYMKNDDGELPDYKFFAFDGFTRAMFVATERSNPNEETKFDFYDMDFKHLPLTNGHPNSSHDIKRPESFEKMQKLANELSKGIPHLRVDFYDINGQVYFGELTFAHWSGMMPFEPDEWDAKFGEWIKLPDSIGGVLIANKGYIIWVHDDKSISNTLTDYKFFCFEGIPKFMYVSKDKSDEPSTDFYDMDGNRLEMRMRDPNSKDGYPLPHNFELMKSISSKLSCGFHHLRVDFYECGGNLYIGELTFFHCGGFARIYPSHWENTIGSWIDLSKVYDED